MPLVVGQGGGPGAMKAAQFVVMAASAALPNERVLTGSLNEIVVTDGGAGAAVTLTAGSLIVQTDQVNVFTVGPQTINTGAIGNQALILKMHAGQTENGFEVQDSAGNVLLDSDENGNLEIPHTDAVIRMGAALDMQFRHDGSNGSFQNNTGNFFVNQFAAKSVVFKTRNITRLTIDRDGEVLISGFTAPTIGLVVKAAAAQTANLTEWQKSDATIYAYVDDVGNAQFGSVEAGALTLGTGAAGIDYTLTVNGETNDGVLTWMEDEDWFDFSDTVKTSAGRISNTTRVAGAHTATAADEIILIDTDGGAFTVDLPVGIEGTHYRISNVGTSGNDVTVDGDAAEQVMGAATQALSDGETINIYYNATEGWW